MKAVQRTCLLALVLGGLLAPHHLRAQVTFDRILRAADEPQNWLTYNGTYSSQRHSGLTQITAANVGDLESKWVLQNQVFGAWQSNPIVVDGIMYVTERPNDVHGPGMRSQVGCSGYTGIDQPTMPGSAVVPTTAVWPSWTTRCSWARWTLGSSRSTRPMAGRSGTSKSLTRVRRIRSPWRPWW